MKFLLFIFLFFSTVNFVSCQETMKNDTIFSINGDLMICKVINISEFDVVYSYPNESLTNTLSKKQIKEIHFSSGRIQKFTEKIVIRGEQDWEKVQLTTIPSDVTGLVKKQEVKGKSLGTTVANMTELKNKAEMQLKKEAARQGCHIVFIQVYNVVDSQFGLVMGKVNINGVSYSYE
jgi:hypothetical protein